MPDQNQLAIFISFDFGTKRIGVAVGQQLTQTARPLATLAAKSGVPNWKEVDQLIDEWQPVAIVVGIPLNMDGTEQAITHAAKHFSNSLKQRYQLTVHEADERLSTKEARSELYAEGGYKMLKTKPIDGVAAQLILESWLREHI